MASNEFEHPRHRGRSRFGGATRRVLSHNEAAYRSARRVRACARLLAHHPHDSDFAAFALYRERRGIFLDVGANIGQSACSFRMFHDAPILSIEPNPEHRRDLELLQRVIRGFDFLMVAAGEENASATLRIPTYRGITVTGAGTLVEDGPPGAWWASRHLPAGADLPIVERPVEVRRLDDFGLDPSFVKVDVEGFELSALRGLRCTLERARPIVLVERSEAFAGVEALLASLGYRPYRYDPARAVLEPYGEHAATNVFFLPAA